MDGQTEQSTIGFHLHRNQLLSFLEDYKYYSRACVRPMTAAVRPSDTIRHAREYGGINIPVLLLRGQIIERK